MNWIRGQLARLSERERRTIGGAALLVLSAWLALKAGPSLAHRASVVSERARLATMTLARGRATLDAEPALREALASRARLLVAFAPRLLAGGSSAEASAELSALVGGAAATHHVRVTQQDARPDSSASVFTRIALHIEAEGDAAGVTGWIAALEEGDRLIRVRSLAINAPEPAAPATQAERLRVNLVIEGWSSGHARH